MNKKLFKLSAIALLLGLGQSAKADNTIWDMSYKLDGVDVYSQLTVGADNIVSSMTGTYKDTNIYTYTDNSTAIPTTTDFSFGGSGSISVVSLTNSGNIDAQGVASDYNFSHDNKLLTSSANPQFSTAGLLFSATNAQGSTVYVNLYNNGNTFAAHTSTVEFPVYDSGTMTGGYAFDSNVNVSFTNVSAVPEPEEWAMLLVGVALVATRLYRQERKNAYMVNFA